MSNQETSFRRNFFKGETIKIEFYNAEGNIEILECLYENIIFYNEAKMVKIINKKDTDFIPILYNDLIQFS